MASALQGASTARQPRRGGPRVRPPGTRPSPSTRSVMRRCLRPALSTPRRWPRTGSACRPGNPLQKHGAAQMFGRTPAAGHEPGSPMPGKHRRPQTLRPPWSRLPRKLGRSAVCAGSDRDAPDRSGVLPWRPARMRACVSLDAMRMKGLVWLGIPADDYVAAVRILGETLCLFRGGLR